MNVLCSFGSATGNSESISKRLHAEAQERGYKATVDCLNQFANDKLLQHDVIVIVCATTGNGDPPENCELFFRWLKKPQTILKGKYYAVLGLGDTNYENFCKMGISIDKRMTELGAIPILKRGTADDATGLEKVIEPWIDNLWKEIAAKKDVILASRQSTIPSGILEQHSIDVIPKIPTYQNLKIVNAEWLTDKDAQKQVIHLEVDASDMKYQVGQVIAILPKIQSEVLLELDQIYTKEDLSTLESLDLYAPLKSHQLEVLGVKDVETTNLIMLMKKHKVYPALSTIQKVVSNIYPRDYSISSSPNVNSKILSFAFTVHEIKLGDDVFTGLCSEYLLNAVKSHLNGQQSFIRAHIATSVSSFEVPLNDIDPLIFVAPGTGISPFIGILSHLQSTHSDVTIFHGCRRSQDFVYKKRLDALPHQKTIHLALSQEGDKSYVQHLVKNHVDDVISKLNQTGRLYICGGVQMCKETIKIVQDRLIQIKGDEAQQIWQSWNEKKQIQQEIW